MTKRRLQLEEIEQCALISWAEYARIDGIHIIDHLIANANGGKRSKSEAGKFKAQGVKSGVSDLFFALPMHGFAGLWLEMKRPASPGRQAGRATDDQIRWIESRRAVGYAGEICTGWDDARMVITAYIKGEIGKLMRPLPAITKQAPK